MRNPFRNNMISTFVNATIIIILCLSVFLAFFTSGGGCTMDTNTQHDYSLWSGHTVSEKVYIDGKPYIKFTDNHGRTTLTPVPQ